MRGPASVDCCGGKSGVKLNTAVITTFAVAFGVAVPGSAQPYSEVTVHDFAPAPIDCTDGMYPETSLIQASDGNLYGTTAYGGSGDGGTVFRISNLETTPVESVLYCFTGGTDGANPAAALIQASDGNLYGTTAQGGNTFLDTFDCQQGCGTVFRIGNLTSSPTVSVIYTFTGKDGDGSAPLAPLVQASDGNLYGTTRYGGSGGGGTVFKITNLSTSPTESVVYSFNNFKGGLSPSAALIQASDGNLYGTTDFGGLGNCLSGNFMIETVGCGTVFKISNLSSSPTGSVIYSFRGGGFQSATQQFSLIQASDGNLYGTTHPASGYEGYGGTVFKISDLAASPTFSEIYSFKGGTDGESPSAALIQAADGNLYGTTLYGGDTFNTFYCTRGCGTVFQISNLATSPTESVIYAFTGDADGAAPLASVIQASNGNLYGTAFSGGAASAGTVFEIDSGLGPRHVRPTPVPPVHTAPIRGRGAEHSEPY